MKVSKNVLLTGSGFSKCFGGFLGSDMHHRLYNIARQRKLDPLSMALLKTKDYEKVFGDILAGSDDRIKSAVNEAIGQLYAELDHAFERMGERRDKALRKFLEGFMAPGDEMGFVFTLNQDLLLERWWRGSPDFCLPGLRKHNGAKVFLSGSSGMKNTPFTRADDRLVYFLPTKSEWEKIDLFEECTPLTYIKLHGSTNFVSKTHGKEVMIIGTEKSVQISREPVLKGYSKLFRDVLCSGNVRLFVVGYGFQDRNINQVLNEALKDYGMSIFLMDPTQHLVDFAVKVDVAKKNEDTLLPGFDRQGQLHLTRSMDGYFPFHLVNDVFPDSQQLDFPEWREIEYRYFGRNIRP